MTKDDELHDLFPGTGAVAMAWRNWKKQLLIGDECALAQEVLALA